jgi:Fe-S cluster assembly protein SufD
MNNIANNYTATSELVDLYRANREIYFEGCAPLMNGQRDEAITWFEKLGIPHKKQENYKYSDLRPAFQNDYDVVPRYVKQSIDLHEIFNCDVPKLESHIVLMINGWYYLQNRRTGNLPEGVVCGSLQHIANEHPELVEKYYGKLADVSKDAFSALNTALAKDGLFLYVPDSVVVEKPIQIINLLKSDNSTFATQRNVFVIGKNAEVKVVFCDHTLNDNYYIANNLIECFVDDDARFGFFNIQNQHQEATNITSLFIQQEKNTKVDTGMVTLNGGIVRNNLSVIINGEHSEANIGGLSLLDGKQHADNFTSVEHRVPNCTSNQLYKNVLDEEATGAFTGRIHVHRDAQKTAAYQRNNNVLMCERSQMNTKPQLVIDADDVRCSHGATIGRIDEDALFYLRARGISEKEARLMLMFAFANEVIATIPVEALRDRMGELIDRRLRGDLNPCDSCQVHCSSK